MPEETAIAQITKEPVFVDENLITRSSFAPAPALPPTAEITLKLEPEFREFYDPFEPGREEEKDLLINIETTGLLPFESKIFSIAFQDLSVEGSQPIVLINNDERALIADFIQMINDGNWTRLIGWNLSFDYRFIFGVMALYRIPSKKYYNLKLRDVQQIYQQVKEEFVYGFQKPNKLTEWAEFLLGIGKLSSQSELLKRYIAGDFDFVHAFQTRQIDMTRDLYDLARFSAAGSFPAQIPTLSEVSTTATASSPGFEPGSSQTRKCPNCLSEQPGGAEFCDICKVKL